MMRRFISFIAAMPFVLGAAGCCEQKTAGSSELKAPSAKEKATQGQRKVRADG